LPGCDRAGAAIAGGHRQLPDVDGGRLADPDRGDALLLRCMEERNFALGVAYAKTDVIQVALFGFVLLGDRIGIVPIIAILVATAGVVLVSLPVGA